MVECVEFNPAAVSRYGVICQFAAGSEARKSRRQSGMQNQIDTLMQAFRPVLAQRSGRQQPAIAHAPVIKHGNFDVARQRIVLQAVVAHHHVGCRVAGPQTAHGVGAFSCYENRSACRPLDKRWLITGLINRSFWPDFQAFLA